MNAKSEIVISGLVNESEINELKSLIPESEIINKQLKGFGTIDYVQLEYFYAEIIDVVIEHKLYLALGGVITQIYRVAKFFINKGRLKIKIKIEAQIKSNKKHFLLYFEATPEEIQPLIKKVNNQIDEIIEYSDYNGHTFTSLSKDRDQVKYWKL